MRRKPNEATLHGEDVQSVHFLLHSVVVVFVFPDTKAGCVCLGEPLCWHRVRGIIGRELKLFVKIKTPLRKMLNCVGKREEVRVKLIYDGSF